MSRPAQEWTRALDDLIGALHHDRLTDDQSSQLQSLLENQPGARRRFAETMHLMAMLSEGEIANTENDVTENDITVPLAQRAIRRQSNGYRMIALTMLATSAALLCVLLWPSSKDTDQELLDEGVAVVTQSYETTWSGDSQLQIGSSVSPGTVSLAAGLIQLEFYRGAVVVVEGPAELEFVDADNLICRYGRLRAHVPPQAEGFTVLSPQVELVDLGTEFGMDVATDGSASIHVFDGKVELYESGTQRSADTRREINESDGAVVSAEGLIEQSKTVLNDFVSSTKLHEMAAERNETRLQQWQSKSREMSDDPHVLLHYAFEKEISSARLLKSHVPDHQRLDGAIIGCRWTEGRWDGKDALEFKHPGDRVRLHIPGEYESLTYSAWVRIDGLDRPFSALVLTNGYDVGEAHWQLRDDGRLLLGVQTPEGHVAYDSMPVLNIKHLGRWNHLVTVYDGKSRQVVHYINGELVSNIPIETDEFRLRFGDTEVGNWGTPVKYSPQKIRNLNGQIDELTLFDRPLSEQEVRAFYVHGRR